MTNTNKACWLVLTALFFAANATAKTCTWTVQGGNWADSANWADGAVPEDGDSVEFAGSGGGGFIQLQGGATAALAGILNADSSSGWSLTDGTVNWADSSSGWSLTDGTVNWADGTVVFENAANFKIYAQLASSDTTTFVKRGAGSLFLYATNTALRCAFVVEGGRILPVDDLSFGVVPETLRADAITLRGGALFNGDAGNLVTIAPTRGVTVEGLGYFAGRAPDTLVVASPITGNGDVCVLQQSGAVRFDAANTYTGETVLGDTQHAFKFGLDVNFSVGTDGALPATTRLHSVISGARLALDGTTQRIAGPRSGSRASTAARSSP